jgi:sulfite reductase alpha subunit-like flavoprotein
VLECDSLPRVSVPRLQDLAFRVVREGRNRGFVPIAMPMDDFNVAGLLDERLVVFIASTTGDGEAPLNMRVCIGGVCLVKERLCVLICFW